MEEIWKDVVGYEGIYIVSNFGNIKNVFKNKAPKQSISKHGYNRVWLNGKESKSMYVHRVVAMSFISNPLNKNDINHKNGIKTDNRVENLEWATLSEQQLHSYNVLKNKQKNRRIPKL